jgi:hypothetical protein
MAYPQLPQRHASETERDNLVVICANCQKVRNAAGAWQSLESYRPRFKTVSFSHGLCEKCAYALYPEVFPEVGRATWRR